MMVRVLRRSGQLRKQPTTKSNERNADRIARRIAANIAKLPELAGCSKRVNAGQSTVKRSELQADYFAGYFAGHRKRERPTYPAAVVALAQHDRAISELLTSRTISNET